MEVQGTRFRHYYEYTRILVVTGRQMLLFSQEFVQRHFKSPKRPLNSRQSQILADSNVVGYNSSAGPAFEASGSCAPDFPNQRVPLARVPESRCQGWNASTLIKIMSQYRLRQENIRRRILPQPLRTLRSMRLRKPRTRRIGIRLVNSPKSSKQERL